MKHKRILLLALTLVVVGWLAAASFSLWRTMHAIRDMGSIGARFETRPVEPATESVGASVVQSDPVEEPAESRSIQDGLIQMEPLVSSLAVAQNCVTVTGPNHPSGKVPEHLPPFRIHEASEQALEERADLGDPRAQYAYATSFLTRFARREMPWDAALAMLRKYDIMAVQNGSVYSANRLGELYSKFDPIEARAWFLIEEKMGGRSVDENEDSSGVTFTDQNKAASEVRANEYIEELDLVFEPPIERQYCP